MSQEFSKLYTKLQVVSYGAPDFYWPLRMLAIKIPCRSATHPVRQTDTRNLEALITGLAALGDLRVVIVGRLRADSRLFAIPREEGKCN